jgi:hypothetical protein
LKYNLKHSESRARRANVSASWLILYDKKNSIHVIEPL